MSNTTEGKDYYDRLMALQGKWWKKIVDLNAPYRWCLQSYNPGFTLDIGCGIGRSLHLLKGNGVGIDHNSFAVEFCRKRGFRAYTTQEFKTSPHGIEHSFDSILLAHVAEHMLADDFKKLLNEYLPYLKLDGKIIVLTPQEKGYASDPTHVTFTDFQIVDKVFTDIHIDVQSHQSFPLPRWGGRLFIYNEFVTVGKATSRAFSSSRESQGPCT